MPYFKFSNLFQIVELLLENGAHLDQLDQQNQSPLAVLQSKKQLAGLGLLPLEHVSLKCIVARAVCKYGITYGDGDLPRELGRFIELHRPTKQNDSDGSKSKTSRGNRV